MSGIKEEKRRQNYETYKLGNDKSMRILQKLKRMQEKMAVKKRKGDV